MPSCTDLCGLNALALAVFWTLVRLYHMDNVDPWPIMTELYYHPHHYFIFCNKTNKIIIT